MILYFTGKKMNLLGSASSALPFGYKIISDSLVESVDDAVNIFTGTIHLNGGDTLDLQKCVAEGNFILKGNNENYDTLYQIVETEYNTADQTIYFYAEDAGMDLLNRQCSAVTYTSKTLREMLNAALNESGKEDWTINITSEPTDRKTNIWDGSSTALERIKSIVGLWKYELYFSFEIDRLKVIKKVINVVKSRGIKDAEYRFRYPSQIDNIVVKKSIANVITALKPIGANDINLIGYSGTYTDTETGDVYKTDKALGVTDKGYVRNVTACNRAIDLLNKDGVIVQDWSYETNNKATLFAQTRAYLQTLDKPEINYEVSFVDLPDDIKVGDRVYVINDAEELYLDSRVLKLETSETADSIVATLGDYLIKEAGISDILANLNIEGSKGEDGEDAIVLSVISSGGNFFHNTVINTTLTAQVTIGNKIITTAEELAAILPNYNVNWYIGGSVVHSGMNYSLTSTQTKESIIAKLEGDD